MLGIPPDCHSGVGQTPPERAKNNFFFANAAILKPDRDQTEDDGDQKEWHRPDDLALKPPRFAFALALRIDRRITPPRAKQQRHRQKYDLSFGKQSQQKADEGCAVGNAATHNSLVFNFKKEQS